MLFFSIFSSIILLLGCYAKKLHSLKEVGNSKESFYIKGLNMFFFLLLSETIFSLLVQTLDFFNIYSKKRELRTYFNSFLILNTISFVYHI